MSNNQVSGFNSCSAGLLICLLGTLASHVLAANANSATTNKQVVGWVEHAVIIPLDATVKVKMDSGAQTSSMDANQIKVYKVNDQRRVKFRLHMKDEKTGDEFYRNMDMPVTRQVQLTGAGGMDRRVAVSLPICIGDQVLLEEFTLRDRDNMLYSVLIGRTTIAKIGLIDVTRTYLLKPNCPAVGDSRREKSGK